ncbi:MAG: hydroxysqualene dehydroxylase HpnE [Planctomycetota bacterium]
MSASDEPIVIVGGGIAGIAAGVRLAEAGQRVMLLETRTKLGGRATSFDDVRTGETIDNCQHVALGCCTNFVDLLRRLAADHLIDWQRAIHWFERGGRSSTIQPSRIAPAPGHLSLDFARARFLSVNEKTAIARAILAMLRAHREEHAGETFGAWLAKHGQPRGAIEKFWEPVIVSACNLACDTVSAAIALHVFQEGFLAHREAPIMGVPDAPLRTLYDGATPIIEAAGGAVRVRTGVASIRPDGVTTSAGESIEAKAVICAVPFERVGALVSPELREIDPRFDQLVGLTHSPILGVHLVFDRPVMTTPNAVLVDAPTQWLFRKNDDGSAVHAVISAADDWLGLGEREVVTRVLADVRTWLNTDAEVRSGRPVMEKRATWAPTPGSEAHRPPAEGPSGIVLAGTYVQTGWPCTMEGATRSGYTAAEALLGTGDRLVLDSLRPQLPVRVLAGAWARGG